MSETHDNIHGNRTLCRQIRGARIRSSESVVTVMPEDLVDHNLLALAGDGKKRKAKPSSVFGGARMKKCHWQDVSEFVFRVPRRYCVCGLLKYAFSLGACVLNYCR